MSLQAFGIKWYFGIGLALPLAATNLPVEPRGAHEHAPAGFVSGPVELPADLAQRALRLAFPAVAMPPEPRRLALSRPEPRRFAISVMATPSAAAENRAWPAGWTAIVDDEIVK